MRASMRVTEETAQISWQDTVSGASIRDAVAELRRLVAAGPSYQRQAEAKVAALRSVWRRSASPFLTRPGGRSPQLGARPTPARQAAQLGDARAVLEQVFGYRSFRPGQQDIIAAVLAGRDCIGIMPTGAGKSLTYQIPPGSWAGSPWWSRPSSLS